MKRVAPLRALRGFLLSGQRRSLAISRGKHRGEDIQDVENDYLQWYVKNVSKVEPEEVEEIVKKLGMQHPLPNSARRRSDLMFVISPHEGESVCELFVAEGDGTGRKAEAVIKSVQDIIEYPGGGVRLQKMRISGKAASDSVVAAAVAKLMSRHGSKLEFLSICPDMWNEHCFAILRTACTAKDLTHLTLQVSHRNADHSLKELASTLRRLPAIDGTLRFWECDQYVLRECLKQCVDGNPTLKAHSVYCDVAFGYQVPTIYEPVTAKALTHILDVKPVARMFGRKGVLFHRPGDEFEEKEEVPTEVTQPPQAEGNQEIEENKQIEKNVK